MNTFKIYFLITGLISALGGYMYIFKTNRIFNLKIDYLIGLLLLAFAFYFFTQAYTTEDEL